MERTAFADERGVWTMGATGKPFGIEWDEIVCVSGSKLDGITEIYSCVALDFEYGEYFELDDAMPGFSAVVNAITEHIPGIPADWFDQIQRLSVNDDPLDVWKKSE